MMRRESAIAIRGAVAAAVMFAFAASAQGGTLRVANNAVDGAGCGSTTSPCRSISRAIANAVAGDTIIVSPGRYGDLNGNGTLGETGEETPAAGCGCMLAVNKPVKLTSSDGAAATVIDAASVAVAKNVLIMIDGGEFGRPGKGFTVTNTSSANSTGIVLDSTDLTVRGNQVVSDGLQGTGIDTVGGPGPMLIEGNQVIGRWTWGIRAHGGVTVRRNQVSRSGFIGIEGQGTSSVERNVVTDCQNGIALIDAASAIGNAALGNTNHGFSVAGAGFSGSIEQNNVFGNRVCGLANIGVPGLLADNNYWGAATGPGADPADQAGGACDFSGGTTTVTPFATRAFRVKAPIKP